MILTTGLLADRDAIRIIAETSSLRSRGNRAALSTIWVVVFRFWAYLDLQFLGSYLGALTGMIGNGIPAVDLEG